MLRVVVGLLIAVTWIAFSAQPAAHAGVPPGCLTNPSGLPTPADADADHLADVCEGPFGTVIGAADTDGDGVQDGVEVGAGTDPTVMGAYAGVGDLDGDGCSNAEEQLADDLPAPGDPGNDRHPGNWWDFYSVDDDDTPAYDPDLVVPLPDTLDILGHFGHGYSGGAYADGYDQGYDRTRALSPRPPGTLIEGNDGVDLGEALASLAQFGFGPGAGCGVPGPVPAEGGGVF